MDAPALARASRAARWGRLAAALALAACVDGTAGPGRLGEWRVRPRFDAGRDPAALRVTPESAAVLAIRRTGGASVVDTTVVYAGDSASLGWVIDLVAEEESLTVRLRLRGRHTTLYDGSAVVAVRNGVIATAPVGAVPMLYVGPPIVTAVVVSPGAATLTALDATQQFTGQALDQDGAPIPGAVFTWLSSAPAVATVDPATGLATAVGGGTATIAATSGGVAGAATLTVAQAVVAVAVTPATITLDSIGARQQFAAGARDATGHPIPGVTFTWSSTDPAVATADPATGLATAVQGGTTNIVAHAGPDSGWASLTVNPVASIASIVVTPATATLTAVGATQQFVAQALDAAGRPLAGVTFAWSSSNGGVATVDPATGLATAVQGGVATVTAAAGGHAGAATITVNPVQSIAAIIVTPGTPTLTAVGATQQFAAQALDASGHPLAEITFSWASSAPAVASIDAASGLATAVANGETTVTATAGTQSGTATLTVSQAIASVEVTPPAAALLALGATQLFTAEARDANGHPVPGVMFTWTSSNAAIATIDPATGLATAVQGGAATITATAGSHSGSATLTVSPVQSIATIVVSPAAATLTALGATQQFVAQGFDGAGQPLAGLTFVWFSSDPAVATIDPVTGLATAVQGGAATITATAGSHSGSATLTVSPVQSVATIVVSPPAATLTALGATQHYTAQGFDGAGQPLGGLTFVWSSSDPAVATIDPVTGLATAVQGGAATITATAGSHSGTATLTVSPVQSVATIVVSPAAARLTALGATQHYTAQAFDGAGHPLAGITFAWSSSDPAIATVDAGTGLATAVQGGAAMITAGAGAITGSATLTVNPVQSIATIVVSPTAAILTALGATQQYTAQALDGAGQPLASLTFTWSSSDPTIATIDAVTGLATAVQGGAATITATAGSHSGSATLTVSPVQSVTTIVVSPPAATLTAFGATQHYTAQGFDGAGRPLAGLTFVWSSSDPAVARIDPVTGLATAMRGGAATITATAGPHAGSATLTVTPVQSIATIVVTPAAATLMALGATQQYTSQAFDGAGQPLAGLTFVWSSSDPTVATVDAGTGLATALQGGAVTIVAKAGSDSGVATLRVSPVESIGSIVVTPATATLTVFGKRTSAVGGSPSAPGPGFLSGTAGNATQQFTAEAFDAAGTPLRGIAFVWASSNESVAVVDSSGLATAVGTGTTVISAAAGGKSGSATLRVRQDSDDDDRDDEHHRDKRRSREGHDNDRSGGSKADPRPGRRP